MVRVIGRFIRNCFHGVRARNASAARFVHREEEWPCEVRSISVGCDQSVVPKNRELTIARVYYPHARIGLPGTLIYWNITWVHVLITSRRWPCPHKVGDKLATLARWSPGPECSRTPRSKENHNIPLAWGLLELVQSLYRQNRVRGG